jgi:hypothetical protein
MPRRSDAQGPSKDSGVTPKRDKHKAQGVSLGSRRSARSLEGRMIGCPERAPTARKTKPVILSA